MTAVLLEKKSRFSYMVITFVLLGKIVSSLIK